ncbi:hypothetical protein ACQ33O_08455 [Ferruginibacter sp. SUN002]|uniref:hypothetical protein n=1 Tax=Ferruginibacter sp. SUN002 TaxID=2937789 RepID=UPI003D35C897
MKRCIIILFILFSNILSAQELFVYTEPASNMAAKSIGIRANTMFMKNVHSDKNEFFLTPEFMWGVSKKIMIHSEAFFNNASGKFDVQGAGIYLKYRFYSEDEVHNHFRLAVYGRYSLNNGAIHDAYINLNCTNSGFEGGIVATKLINKVAISASGSLIHALDNGSNAFGSDYRNAINYTLSLGKLMLPREYRNYDQPNLNLMVELLGQNNLGKNKQYFLDLAPSLQLILKSRMRLDAGYRFPLSDKSNRATPNSVLLRFEYNLFNVY